MNIELQNKSLNLTDNMLQTISYAPVGTGFLAFRDIGVIIKEHVKGDNALDFGCGAGRSSRILQEHGLKVTGVGFVA